MNRRRKVHKCYRGWWLSQTGNAASKGKESIFRSQGFYFEYLSSQALHFDCSFVPSPLPFPYNTCYNTISFRAYYQQVHVEVVGQGESRVKSTYKDCDRDEYLQFRVHIHH